MNFIVAASTDIGLIKETNQDCYSVRVYSSKFGKIVFAVMCDGMGGLEKGEIASASVANAFCKWADNRFPTLCEEDLNDDTIRKEWTDIVKEYNEKIQTYSLTCGIHMGTTVTTILLHSNRYFIMNIGDTRAYEISDTVDVLTKDQTVVAQEVELGHLSWEEAEQDPRRSVLLQCVGASEEIIPEFVFGKTKLDAVYILCTDGFRHEISNDEIFQYLNPDVMLNCDGMKRNMEQLIDLNKQRKERDNISVISIRTF